MSDEVLQEIVPPRQFKRGAKPTPKHVIAAAPQYRTLLAPPTEFAVVPPHLDMWDNDVDGDCVTAEEAFAKAVWSVYCGLPELFIPTQEVIRWASKYGFLNGANLDEVMNQMASDGFTVNGVNYKDGPKEVVDYTNEDALQSAISVKCPVKIAIDANALPSGAGNQQGWFATGGSPGQFPSTDHCTSLSGYGTAKYLYQQLGVPLPAALDPTKEGYLHYTWRTIGFVDHAWLMSTCTEAWVRNPTTPGQSPVPVPPTPVPVPPGPPVPPTPPAPTPGGVVMIPSLNVRVFGMNIGHTDPVTVPVTQSQFHGRAAGWTQTLADVTKLLSDFQGGNYGALYADLIAVLTDLGILTPPALAGATFGPVVPWWQVVSDASSLAIAVWRKDWPTAVSAVLKLASDFGLQLSRSDVVAAVVSKS
jgi:hypothetical protein